MHSGQTPRHIASRSLAVRAVKHGTANRVDDDIEPARGRAGTSGPGAEEASPTQAGTFSFPMQEQDSWDNTVTATLTITINP